MSVIERLHAMIAEIQPVIIRGDEDSIYLTQYQQGLRDGLRRALLMLKEEQS